MKRKLLVTALTLCMIVSPFPAFRTTVLASDAIDPGTASAPGNNAFETYSETRTFDNAYLAVVDTLNAAPLGFDPNTADTVTISGTAPNRTVEVGMGMSITVKADGNKATLSFNGFSGGTPSEGEPAGDKPAGGTPSGGKPAESSTGNQNAPSGNPDPESANYMYVDNEGKFCCTTENGDYEYWFIDENGQLYYNAEGTPYYFDVIDGKNSTMSTVANTDIFVFSGEKNAGGGGGGNSNETDSEAPVFTVQPGGYKFTTAGDEASFTIEAVRTTDTGTTTEDITYQWYMNGEKIEGQIEKTLEINFAEKEIGTACTIHCEATYNDGVKDHTTKSTPASYIIAAGQTEDYLFFSDIHEESENIADVLRSYMKLNENQLPKIVFASGDYTNGNGPTETGLEEQLQAIDAMLGGLETYYLAGNHESSTLITDPEGSYNKGTGCILNDDVYLYTINYDEIGSDYSGISAEVEAFLSGITEPKPVIFASHASLHMMAGQNGDSAYNIDLSDQLVDVLNKYGKTLNIFFFFGHNHSKGESEFYRTAGDFITSTNNFSSNLTRTLTLNFNYGHMGYLNTNIGGQSRATVLSIGEDVTSLYMIDSDGIVENMSKTITGAGGLDVPIVTPFETTTEAGTILYAKTDDNKGSYNYEWYVSNNPDTSSSDTSLIENETNDYYITRESDIDKYIFCKVISSDGNAFATTTATRITEKTVTAKSSSRGKSSHSVAVADTACGNIAVSTKSASAGSTVTLKITADKGQTLKTITVIDKNGLEIPLVVEKAGEIYTFTMPSSAVSVSATFTEDNTMQNLFTDVKATDYFYDSVLWAALNGITTGADDIHFNPGDLTTRAQMITFLWRAAGSPEPVSAACRFTDVKSDAYYYKAVLWAIENGITDGVSKTTFCPEKDITRTQAITFLWRYEGSINPDSMTDNNSTSTPFCDVDTDAYYYNAVLWAKAGGITSGVTETVFAPNDPCTRAQVVTFLYRDLTEENI